jgi:DeoR/GlpR family transcriptional regulator of sugar metabolism
MKVRAVNGNKDFRPPLADGLHPLERGIPANGKFDFAIGDHALPAKRHQELLRLMCQQGQITVHELSSHFQVSLDTVRRDLDGLAKQGLLTRTHGGAVAAGNLVHRESAPVQRLVTPSSEQKRIARAALGLIRDGESLVVNGGSITKAFAEELNRHDLTIVTNNINFLTALPPDCCRDVHVIGGRYKPDAQITVGPMLVAGMGITVDCAVVGVDGVTAKEGLSIATLEEALMASAMITSARRTIVLVDHSKLGHGSYAHVCAFESIQALVTDQEPNDDLTRGLKEARVEVLVAPEE